MCESKDLADHVRTVKMCLKKRKGGTFLAACLPLPLEFLMLNKVVASCYVKEERELK